MSKKAYVVIGGSSGIGWALLQRLSESGAEILHLSRSASLSKELPGVHHVRFDALNGVFPKDALPDRLDGLAYCPGSIRLRPFARLKKKDYLDDFGLNFLCAVDAIQACLPILKKSETIASIVLFSTVAVQTGMPFHASIASAKGAVEGLVRSLAAEFAPRIRVNAVAPSLTDTPLAGSLLADENRRKASAERHPLNRIGSPDDIAAAVAFLLGESSGWITGQILSVDGGIGSMRLFK